MAERRTGGGGGEGVGAVDLAASTVGRLTFPAIQNSTNNVFRIRSDI